MDTTIHYFHSTDDKIKEYTTIIFERAVKGKKITREDDKLIKDFVLSLKKMSPGRRFKYYHYLIEWRTYIGPYKKNTVQDIQRGVDAFYDCKRYKASVQREAIYMLRRFLMWLVKEGQSNIDMSKLKDKLKLPSVPKKTKNRDMMLTPEETVGMLKACKNSLERALVSALCYGGFRAVEMGTLKWHQVTFTDRSVKFKVMEKTERERDVPVIEAREYMAAWKADYPGKPEGDNFVFINRYGEPFRYMALTWRLKAIAKKAGITKNVTGHLPRHSRITDLQVKGISDSAIKYMMWGGESQMLSVYSHYQSDDAEDEMAKYMGISKPKNDEKTKDESTKSHICQSCGLVCGPGMDYCPKCANPLTEKAKNEIEDVDSTMAKTVAEQQAKIDALQTQINEILKKVGS